METRRIAIDYAPRAQFRQFHARAERFACIVAHRRAGKTVACVHDLQRGALSSKLDRPRFAYIAPYRGQAKAVVWDYLVAAMAPVRPLGAVDSVSELKVDYPNGGQVRLYGADNPNALRGIYLEQLFTFGDPRRNPAAHVVSTAYFALLSTPFDDVRPGTKYSEAAWLGVGHLPALAYDHNQIAKVALERLRAKVAYTNVVYGLLPRQFTLSELQRVYEVILGRSLDRRNFRKALLASGLVRRLSSERRGAHRPAALYAFRERRLRNLEIV